MLIKLNDIVNETNRYAIGANILRRTQGGQNWEQFIVGGLKAFIAMALYMEMKKQPN